METEPRLIHHGDCSVITRVLTVFFHLLSKNWVASTLSDALRPSHVCESGIPQTCRECLGLKAQHSWCSWSLGEDGPQGRSSPGMQFSSTQEPLPSSLDIRQWHACGMPSAYKKIITKQEWMMVINYPPLKRKSLEQKHQRQCVLLSWQFLWLWSKMTP